MAAAVARIRGDREFRERLLLEDPEALMPASVLSPCGTVDIFLLKCGELHDVVRVIEAQEAAKAAAAEALR